MYPQKPRLYADGGMPGQQQPTEQPQPDGGGDPSVQPLGGPDDPNQPQEDPALAQIEQGVQAFVQSRDPNVAMQVCDQLAQMMGLGGGDPNAGGGDPNQQQALAGDPNAQGGSGDPMGQRGMRMPMYKKGGVLPRADSTATKAKAVGGKKQLSAIEKWNQQQAANKAANGKK